MAHHSSSNKDSWLTQYCLGGCQKHKSVTLVLFITQLTFSWYQKYINWITQLPLKLLNHPCYGQSPNGNWGVMISLPQHFKWPIQTRVRPWRCGCLVIWFCYLVTAKPSNKTVAHPGPDPLHASPGLNICISSPQYMHLLASISMA